MNDAERHSSHRQQSHGNERLRDLGLFSFALPKF